jgi:hypothetical protein
MRRIAGVALVSLLTAGAAGAQDVDAFVKVQPTIVVVPGTESLLRIDIGLPRRLPEGTFVSLRGLPATMSVPDGHAVGPGSWAIPLRALPLLRTMVSAETSGQSEITVSLIAMDGRLLAQARAVLVIQRAHGAPSPVSGGRLAPRAGAPRAPELVGEQRAKAERLQARGEAYLANGNIIAARDFFERAADAGLAAGALLLAVTYDPTGLEWLKVPGVAPDRALARKWYERARDLGAVEAQERLVLLEGN